MKSFFCANYSAKVLCGHFLAQASRLPNEIGITRCTLKLSTLRFLELENIPLNQMAFKGPLPPPHTHTHTPVSGFLNQCPILSPMLL